MIGLGDFAKPNTSLLFEVVNHTIEFIKRIIHAMLKKLNPDEIKQN